MTNPRLLLELAKLRKKDRDDEEMEGLVANDDGVSSDGDKSKDYGLGAPKGPPPGFSFSIPRLALVTLLLLTVSLLMLERQCFRARSIRSAAKEPFVTEWKVLTKRTHLAVRKRATDSGGTVTKVAPNETIKFVGADYKGFDHVISPALGWTRHVSMHTDMPYFEKVREDPDVSWLCPLIYTSIDSDPSNRYMNAPTGLVIGQSFWNATQVFHLFLLIAMLYDFAQPNKLDEKLDFRRKLVVRCIAAGTVCLLPFAAYLISPGAHIWTFLTLVLSILAILTPTERLQLSIGRKSVEPAGDVFTRPWLLIREETLCMLCYLGSSLYNSAAGAPVHRWPWFHKWWPWIDRVWNLDYGGDVTPVHLFNMGMSSLNITPFVSRAMGSVTASYVFSGVWSVLPFLYSFNFIIMIAMSNRSPGKWVQRFFATFGLIHFLFWTDVVSYKYGRGYRNDHEDFYHWTEKWSWRIGILIPLYQNCTNGHWGKDAHYFPIVGQVMRYGVMIWGILFFVFQTIQADLIRTYGFLTGGDSSKGLIRIWGLDKKSYIMKELNYPYFTALVWMWVMYGLLHVTCFQLNRISLRRAASRNSGTGGESSSMGPAINDEAQDEEREHLVV